MSYFEYSEDRDPRDGKGPWNRHWTYERELRRSSSPNRLVIWSAKIECWEWTPYFRYDTGHPNR